MKVPKKSKPHLRNRAESNARRLKRKAAHVEQTLPVDVDKARKKRRVDKAEEYENLRDELKRSSSKKAVKGSKKKQKAKGKAKGKPKKSKK